MSDPWDDVACPHMAEWIESVSFPCGCGKTKIWLTDLEMSCAIDWLKNGPEKVPIYHMGMLGCCEDLRCTECDNMPSHCQCNRD